MLDEYKTHREVWEENYDTVNLRSDVLVSGRVLKLLSDVHGKTILDIGCGNGKVARKLAQGGAKVFAIDVVQEQIEFAKKIEGEKKQGINYFVGNIQELNKIDFPIGKFDIVISLMTHLYLSEGGFVNSFKIIFDKLGKGGRFIYGNIHPTRIALYEKKNYFESQLLKAKLPTLAGKVFSTEFYHHPMDVVINSIVNTGLNIKQIYEPRPDDLEIKKYPTLLDPNDKLPQYLIIDTIK